MQVCGVEPAAYQAFKQALTRRRAAGHDVPDLIF